MTRLLHVPERVSLALHAAAILANDPSRPLSTRDIARRMKVSEAHLSKVLQRLGRTGLLRSVRGPKGGYLLTKRPSAVTLLEIYQDIEGRLDGAPCLFGEPVCGGGRCILGDALPAITRILRDRLSRTHLSDVVSVFAQSSPAPSRGAARNPISNIRPRRSRRRKGGS